MDELIAAALAVVANAKSIQPYAFAEVLPGAPPGVNGIRPIRQVWRVEHGLMVDLACALTALDGAEPAP